MNEFRFPKSRRLLTSAQFERVFQRRRSRSDGVLILYACENDLGYPRLGLVVSRKVGNAVVRARWKRCLREAFRLAQHELPPGLDLMALPRPAATPTTPRVQQSLRTLAWRLSEPGRPGPGAPRS